MRQQVLSLGSAITLSVCIHIATASLLLGPPEKGDQDFGSGGIAVSLGPAGREPGGEQAAAGKADTWNSEAAAIENAEPVNTVQPADTVPPNPTKVFESTDATPIDADNLIQAQNTPARPLENPEAPEPNPVDSAIPLDAVEATAVPQTNAAEPSQTPPDDLPKAIEKMPPTPTEPIETMLAGETLQAIHTDAAALPMSNIVREETERRPDSVEPVDQVRSTEYRTDRVSAFNHNPKPQPSPPVPKHRPRRAAVEHTDARVAEGVEPATPLTQEAIETAEAIGRPPQTANLMAGQGGRSGAAGRSETGSGSGTPGAAADYYTQLQAWLEKYKRYPRRAKLRNEQGVVVLRFLVTRGGEVGDFGIEKSSGHSLLDEEVREMIQRAQPLPKIPPEMHESEVELLIPVQFFLR